MSSRKTEKVVLEGRPRQPRVGHGGARVGHVSGHLETYFWLILKNVIGWLFILASPVLGIALPGPGGIPLFLIGLALVTFPGKRRITSRVLRARRLHLESGLFTILTATFSVLITAGLIWYFGA